MTQGIPIDWKKLCEGCGRCCGPVPFPEDQWEELSEFIVTPPVLLDRGTFRGMVVPMTHELKCCFLTADKRCTIYPQRPEVCQLQGNIPELPCPKKESALCQNT